MKGPPLGHTRLVWACQTWLFTSRCPVCARSQPCPLWGCQPRLAFPQAPRKPPKPKNLEGRGQEPTAFPLPLLCLPQMFTATITARAAEEAVGAAEAGACGGQRQPGAPVAPAAAGGSGCWACCSPGCCSWGYSSASSLWVREDSGRRAGVGKCPGVTDFRGQR